MKTDICIKARCSGVLAPKSTVTHGSTRRGHHNGHRYTEQVKGLRCWGSNINNQNMYNKEDLKMSVLAKPVDKIIIIKADETQKFIERFNNSKVDQTFLTSCKKAGDLFRKRR